MQSLVPLNTWSLNILYNKINNISNYVNRYHKIHFAVLGDSHLVCTKAWNNQYTLNLNGEYYKKILKHIANNNTIAPMFIIHGGDIVDAGDNIDSFAAFVQVTKDVLNNTDIPIFISIGNHDFDRYKVSSENFESYIGPVRDIIHIPGTYIKYIYLNTNYSDAPANNYMARFSKEDIELLINESKIKNNKYHYLIDFHIPLGNSSSYLIFNNHELSWMETTKFFNSITSLNVISILCHHKHISHKSRINIYKSARSIPYIISGCGGNHHNNQNFSYYYITIDTNNYKITSCRKYLVL